MLEYLYNTDLVQWNRVILFLKNQPTSKNPKQDIKTKAWFTMINVERDCHWIEIDIFPSRITIFPIHKLISGC